MVLRSLFLICLFNIIDADQSVSDLPAVCPKIITKPEWKARPASAVEYAIIPVKNVIFHHTASFSCNTEQNCKAYLQSVQNYHMDELDFHDIGYNFLIGGDGNVYEGAGWHKVGAHTRGYNTRSVGVAFIGNFQDKFPSTSMLKAAKQLLECGVELGELDTDYKLFGAKQVSATLSPGSRLYREIKTWSHYTSSP